MTVIRDMTRADLDAVSLLAEQLVLLHHSWDRTRFFTTPTIAGGYRRYFESQLGERGTVLLTAEVDGAVAGFLFGTLSPRDWEKLLNPHGAVHDLFVAPAHRKAGVAAALMNAAKARFKELGAQQVVLYSAAANSEGQALFKKLGYRPTMIEMTLDL